MVIEKGVHMKNTMKIALASGFTLSYATFLSLGFECLLVFMGACMGIALDSNKGLLERYPNLIPFCVVVGTLALLMIIGLLALNLFASAKLDFSAAIWSMEVICACVISIPMIKIWEIVFEYLRMNY